MSDRYCKVCDFDFIAMERVDKVRWSLQVGTLFEAKNYYVRTGENQSSIHPSQQSFLLSRVYPSLGHVWICYVPENNKWKTTHHFAGVRHVVRVQVLDEHVERSFAFFRKRRRVERGFLAVYHCEHNNNRNTSIEKTFAGSRI